MSSFGSVPHPFVTKTRNPIWSVINPSSTGVVFGAIVSALPDRATKCLLDPIDSLLIENLPVAGKIPDRVYLAVIGFLLGCGAAKGLVWIRFKLLRSLLAYQGWVTKPRSFKVKAWAMLLKLCKGPGPYSTYAFQPYLPKQPLPTLDGTLNKWLQVSSDVFSKEDFEVTKTVVEDFRQNEGPALQKFLEQKFKKEDSYIHDYWLSGVYLSTRVPLINSNFFAIGAPSKNRNPSPLSRGAIEINILLKFAKLLKEEKIPPVVIQDLVPLCMAGYRHNFNTCRVPGEHMDSIAAYPEKQHLIITRKGQYYKTNLYYTDSKGKTSVATTEEIKMLLENIVKETDRLNEEVPPVAALTGQNRNVWAKHRQQLMEQNQSILQDIESALFIIDLNDHSPKDFSELGKMTLAGSGHDRWFDKSITFCIFENSYSGFLIEHSVVDAMVFMTLSEHKMVYEQYGYNEHDDIIRDPNNQPRQLPNVERLVWDVVEMEDEIENAKEELMKVIDDLQVNVVNAKYGKGFMKKQRLSPDGYIQMALQLAYYKLHKKVVKTYEPSTGRLFLLGRTETINPLSESSASWLKAMENPEITKQTKLDLLRKAIKIQSSNRLTATVGQGCDRHLFALMCASMQQGMDMPKIFQDKAWQSPYVLSTSQTPIRSYEYGADLDFYACNGGFAPNSYNGYGIAYGQFGDEILNLGVTCWKSCEETDIEKFGQAFHDAMEDMKQLF